MKNRVLVVAPHADDEVLGCAGAIMRCVAQGDDVYILVVSDRVIDHEPDPVYVEATRKTAGEVARRLGVAGLHFSGLRDEQLDARLIDVIMAIEHVVEQVRPNKAFVPDAGDSDQDHRATAQACRVALRGVDWVYAYEVPGPSRHFAPTYYVDIADRLDAKVDLMAAYEGEMRVFPTPRSPEGIRALSMVRGMESGCRAAEAFKLLKGVDR